MGGPVHDFAQRERDELVSRARFHLRRYGLIPLDIELELRNCGINPDTI